MGRKVSNGHAQSKLCESNAPWPGGEHMRLKYSSSLSAMPARTSRLEEVTPPLFAEASR